MNEHDAMAWSEEKGFEDGARVAPYSPPFRRDFPDYAEEVEAYEIAYVRSFFIAMQRIAWPGGCS